MKSLRAVFIASALALALVGVRTSAQESPFKFEFHGWVTGSLYNQDQVFSGQFGQGLLFFAPTPAANAPCKPVPPATTCTGATKSGSIYGGDVRQSRFIFVLTGPEAFGAKPKAYFEGDFGGTIPGTPLVEQWGMRMRAAYAELNWGMFVFQAGQFSANLAFAQMPDSLSHIMNPLSFGAGNFGWRAMGVTGIVNVPMDGWKMQFAGRINQAKAANDGPATAPAAGSAPGIGYGIASGTPALELRAMFDGKAGGGFFSWLAYGDVFFQSTNLKGFGTTAPNGVTVDGQAKKSYNTTAFELGGKFGVGPVWLSGNFFTGNGLGPWAGALLQQGDIKEIGYWANLGVNIPNTGLQLSATYGQSLPDDKDVRKWGAAAAPFANANQKKDNTLIQGQAKYTSGGYSFALEYIRYETTYMTGTLATPGTDIKTNGNQIILTAGYFF